MFETFFCRINNLQCITKLKFLLVREFKQQFFFININTTFYCIKSFYFTKYIKKTNLDYFTVIIIYLILIHHFLILLHLIKKFIIKLKCFNFKSI